MEQPAPEPEPQPEPEPVQPEPPRSEPVEPTPKPKASAKRAAANRDVILDRLSRMKEPKREEVMTTVEEHSNEPTKIVEEIKKTRGRLKVLRSAEELLRAPTPPVDDASESQPPA